MIKLHPVDNELNEFAEGILPAANSLLVSAHCDMCYACRHKVLLFTENLSDAAFPDAAFADVQDDVSIERDFITMFDAITREPTPVYEPAPLHKESTISFDGRQFTVPSTLARFVDRMGEWSYLVGKLWQARVEIGGGKLAHFLYIEKGGRVPEHTHKGTELTLVINGKFNDGIRDYDSGDYISLNETHTHSPVADVDEGCLVFSIIDQPLHFTSGWAKFINPLSQLYFKANTHQ